MQEYNSIDQRLHLLCQILAKVTANFIPEKEYYSHTNLAFDPMGKRFLCRWIDTGTGKITLSLNLTTFSFQWVNEGLNVIKEVSIPGKTPIQLESEIETSLQQVGIKSTDLPLELKYEIEQYPFIHVPFKQFNEDALNSWMYYRTLANEACDGLLKFLNDDGAVRIWPHHFDSGIYIEIDGKIGLGFGLAMKDSMVNSPYFYLSGYPLKDQVEMANLPTLNLGKWYTGDWKGAVLPIGAIDKMNVHERSIGIHLFIQQAFGWYQSAYLS